MQSLTWAWGASQVGVRHGQLVGTVAEVLHDGVRIEIIHVVVVGLERIGWESCTMKHIHTHQHTYNEHGTLRTKATSSAEHQQGKAT